MENYLLKSSLSLFVLYAFYRPLLRYEFNHQLNRGIGLTCVLFSAILPFIQLEHVSGSGYLTGAFYVVANETSDFQHTVSSAVPDNAINAFAIVYVIGASFFLLRSICGLATLFGLYFNSPRCRRWGFTVVTLSKSISPFTFFNILFIGDGSMDDQEREAMLLHERVHRDQYHSIDTIVLEALTIIYWFNPVIWFFQRDIKAQHEYFADQNVLKKGIDPIAYQLTLFKVQTGASLEVGNYLSKKTSLTKRFNMMSRTKSESKGSYGRAGLFAGVMTVILIVGAYPEGNGQAQGDKIATYEGGQEAMYQAIKKSITYPVSARSENRTGLVEVSFTVNEKGHVENVRTDAAEKGNLLSEVVVIGYTNSTQEPRGIDETLKSECIRVVESLGKFVPAEKEGKPHASVLVLPIRFKLN